MFDFLEKYIMGPMTKFSQFKFVRAITQAGMSSVAFTIVGSMFLVLSILPDAFPVLTGIWAATFDRIEPLYLIAYNATMSAIALYFLVVTAYEYTRIIHEEDEIDLKPIMGALMAIFAYFMLMVELTVVDGNLALVNDAEAGVLNGYATGSGGLANLASTGLFTAFITAWLSVQVYKFCISRNISIKMPDAVPEGVARSFSALIPAFFLAIICMVITGALAAVGTNLFDVVAIPFGFVTNIVGTLPGCLLIIFLIHALWLVGIHGANIIGAPLTAIALSNLTVNLEGGSTFWAGDPGNAFIYPGGSGATLGLVVMMCVLAKSDQLKYLGRAAIVPGLFNINEPILFGLPIVYNPAMAIPFICAPLACTALSYVCVSILHLVKPIVVQAAWPTPGPIHAFLSTGGDPMAIVLNCVVIVLAALIYFPFFKKMDADAYAEEQAKETAAA